MQIVKTLIRRRETRGVWSGSALFADVPIMEHLLFN